ncbi:PHD-finger domain-containing protein [Diplocarpon rosae]|nr:PHD-finger domain-containing protein [Diplocarpon rosae]
MSLPRKLSRAQLQEQDELAPPKDFASVIGSKRRRLNTYGSSPAGGSRNGFIKRKNGTFPLKNEKENMPDEDEQDELADDSNNNEETTGNDGKDFREVQDSESEETASTRRIRSQRPRPSAPPNTTPTRAKAVSRKGSAKSKLDRAIAAPGDNDIWEVPESPPSTRHGRNLISTAERAKALLLPAAESSPQKRASGLGRPRKSDILKQAKILSKRAVREKMMAGGEDGVSDEEDEQSAATLAKKRTGQARLEEDLQHRGGPPSNQASTGKKRGRPSKMQLYEMDPPIQAMKGILTPVKQRTERGRKSVAFGVGDEVDLGFKDLPVSAKTTKTESLKKPTPKLEATPVEDTSSSEHDESDEVVDDEEGPGEQAEPEDSDDDMCAICSELHSRKKNPIMFCDGCNLAVHQKCYQVAKVPSGDWFCRDCQPETGDVILLAQPDKKTPVINSRIPHIDGIDGHLRRLQRILLDRLSGQKRIKLRGHDEEMQKVHQVVEQTVLAGEGNSMLVIGARGCGKTTLVESVVSELSRDHRDSFHVVRLNGFLHTDDKLALKDTWRQLGREMELQDDVAGKINNYSDTLASLLALLSHPSEISESQPEQTAKSVIFILDEFDLFTTHPRQTLLYNLFDIAQARKAPIVVLGLTTRVDVVESLEKRVKSRFSHRYVHLSLPRSLPAFWDICRGGLMLGSDELDDQSLSSAISGQEEFVSFWESMIEDLYHKDTLFKRHIQSEFYRSKSVPAFFTSCIIPIANLSHENLPLTGKSFVKYLSSPDSKLQVLPGLSELELALLIAAARLDIILDTDTCNFAMAYDEYSSLTARYKIQTSSSGVAALGASAKVWGRDVALGAWERLAEYGLLVPAAIGGGSGRDFGTGGRMWKIDVGLEEIPGSVECLSGFMAKWCREI